jgi:hypothetical protein
MVKRGKIDPDYIDRISKRTYGSEPLGLAELKDPYVAIMHVHTDGVVTDTLSLPMMNTARRLEPSWNYQMPEGKHTIKLKWINPDAAYEYRINDMIVYSGNEPKSNLPVTEAK